MAKLPIRLFNEIRSAAPEQGGLLTGKNPTRVDPADPLRLWIIQLGIIVATAGLLSIPLKKVRQPKVIAEVLGGILLGPTAFGRIPGFTAHIFPHSSLPFLNLTANIGLCLFLFLVGLEIDTAVIKRNARLSIGISLAGMIVPFGIGVGLSYPIYKHFISESIKFAHFMLFTGVAFSITAFPVLCRILTELKLLDTTVGIVVLSAGVGNDIVGWTLLALSVALVNAGTGLTALYILLTCIGWTLFLLIPMKKVLRWVARSTGSIESGPTVLFMTSTMLLLFGSAFFTDIIGVHAIFGAFLAGLIVPREGNLAIALTEKLEDFVAIIFLPLYFTLSGLSTNLGLLNNGITWAYTFAIMAAAFFGKFGGCFLAARFFAGFNNREAGAIGSLMSCKGLVELIVLNVGLSAGILTPRVFSMFVLEALTLTCITTPLVTRFYPPHVRRRITAIGVPYGNVTDGEDTGQIKPPVEGYSLKRRITVVLDQLEHLPGAMALSQLIHPPYLRHTVKNCKVDRPHSRLSDSGHPWVQPSRHDDFAIQSLRLIELSDRVSAVMKGSAVESLLRTDPILAIFKMFGRLNGLRMTATMAIVPSGEMAETVVERAGGWGSDLIIVPWLPPRGAVGNVEGKGDRMGNDPLDGLFWNESHQASGSGAVGVGRSGTEASMIHSQFVRRLFAQAKTDVALFVDQSAGNAVEDGAMGTGMVMAGRQHLFLPFFGGPDDRLALEVVMQICEGNESVSATVLRMMKKDVEVDGSVPLRVYGGDGRAADEEVVNANLLTIASVLTTSGMPDTVYGEATDHLRLQSETADNVLWSRYVADRHDKESGSSSPSRIELREVMTPIPLHAALAQARVSVRGRNLEQQGGRLLVVTGRSRRMAVENHGKELKEIMEEYGSVSSDVRKTIGDVASAYVVGRVGDGVVVVQAVSAAV